MSKRQFRILMLLTVISGLVGGGLSDLLFRDLPARAAQGTTAPKVIEAQKFRLVDAAGKERATLGLEEDGNPGLALIGTAGKSGTMLFPSGLGLFDATGRPRAALKISENGNLGLGLYDATGRPRAVLGLGEDGTSGLSLFDAAGKGRAEFGLVEDGTPALGLLDAAGKMRATFSLKKDSSAGLVLFNEKGDVLWQVP